MDLAGKVVVVTGSGNGIGRAFARRFVSEGARVVITDVDAEAVAQTVAELDVVGLAVDIIAPGSVRAVADLAREQHGTIDVWFSNAGVAGPADEPDEFQRPELWDTMWRLHVLAHLEAAREVLPEMVARGDGYLLNTASAVALSNHPEKASYAVTKHGALALAEWLAIRYRSRGIKVSCLCAGPILTRMILDEYPPDHFAVRNGLDPTDVADLVVRGIADERFLILTREGTEQALVHKATDYDNWIEGMAKPWR